LAEIAREFQIDFDACNVGGELSELYNKTFVLNIHFNKLFSGGMFAEIGIEYPMDFYFLYCGWRIV